MTQGSLKIFAELFGTFEVNLKKKEAETIW